MICNRCGHKLPNDSEFCQYCGNKLDEKNVAPAGNMEVEASDESGLNDSIIAQQNAPTKTKFCHHCGSAIDEKTKVCTGCGKKHFKGFKLNKFVVTVIILSMTMVAISGLNVIQFVNNQELQSEIDELNQQIDQKKSTIKTLENNTKRLQTQLTKSEKLTDFIDEYAAFVEKDGTGLYHKFDCQKFKKDYFWIYNIEAAKGRGYEECSVCH